MKVMCEIQLMCTSPKGLPSQKDLWQITTHMTLQGIGSISMHIDVRSNTHIIESKRQCDTVTELQNHATG